MQQKRALVFEDDASFRELLKTILEERNYQVTATVAPACYLTIDKDKPCPLSQPHYDVLITDIYMPVTNGLEFIEKSRLKGCKIPTYKIAVISGNWTDDDLARAKALGCSVFHKPFDINRLRQWLSNPGQDLNNT